MRFRLRRVSALLALIILLVAACATVPITGRRQLLLLPESVEIDMGVQAYREILAKEKVSADPELNSLVRRVGGRIAAATGRSDYKWEFKVIENDKMLNAFALPGGKVAVYTGILPITKDDTGLAVVIGHEVAHAIARHGGERISQTLLIRTGLAVVQAAMGRKDPQTVRDVTGLLGAGAAVGIVLPFSRKQELEADHLGLILMAKAGYDPRAARAFWLRMMEASKGREKPPELLSTHPADETRIREIERLLPEALRYYRGSHGDMEHGPATSGFSGGGRLG